MVWKLLTQQQQCGAQLHARADKALRPGEAPAEAAEGREAQDHEQAGATPRPGESPASDIANRHQDNTPSAPDPHVDWDEVVQPERQPRAEDSPLPEGK